MNIRKTLLLAGLAVCFSFSFAEDGWVLLKQNDHKGARKAFKEILEKDSTNASALKGLIFLSEIEQDKLSFRKYANTLIRSSQNENYYMLFQHMFEGKNENVLTSASYSEKAKIYARFQAAANLKENRKFEEANKAYTAIITPLNWSLIGPFKNISGSGHITKYAVEEDAYNESKTYKNENGLELKWVIPKFSHPNGIVYFEDYLPNSYKDAVFYASTFITVPEKTAAQIRISRKAPMKIWVDNALVFESKEKINFNWDNEIVSIEIPAGTHRVLVKTSEYSPKTKYYDFLNFYDDYADYDNFSGGSSTSFDSYDFGNLFSGVSYGGKNQSLFAIRFTDKEGKLLQQIIPASATSFSPNTFPVTSSSSQPVMEYFTRAIKNNPDDLFNYYALNKASLQAGISKSSEEFFVKAQRQHPYMVFFKYLAAKLYAANGKIEKAYNTLNDIDQTKTPIFGQQYEKFLDIDLKTDEEKYIAALDKLRDITPSNYDVIKAYIKYYNKKGMQKEKKEFIKKMQEEYSDYKESLQYELDNDENKPYKDATDKERSKWTKETLKNVKVKFNSHDYTEAIDHYKDKGKSAKVLALYNELIKVEPYKISYQKDKAHFLFQQEKYDEAIKELEEVLRSAPYDADAMEEMGDIHDVKNKDDKKEALSWYSKARFIGGSYSIDTKIEKIEGQKTLKKLFVTKTFADVLKEDGWKNKYDKEESVVLLFSRDLIYDTLNYAEAYQQIMIKILTDKGAKDWTEYDFSFLGNLNTVKVVKPNGAEIVPDKRGGYVVFKNLEPGDIIQIDGTYKWRQRSELDNEISHVHYISFDAPIYYDKFEVAIPQGIYLEHITYKIEDNVKKETRDGYDFYKWEYNNIEKIQKEDAVPDNIDLFASVQISSMRDWSKLVEWYDKTTYRKLEMTYEVKEALDSIIKSTMTKQEQLVALYNYITKEIKYSYVSFLQSGYIPKDPALTLSAKIGDCKDVATLMLAMLSELGIESYYTLVKTNAFNHQEMLPSLSFDHVVVCAIIDGKKYFSDLTTDFYPNYVLTENDYNAFALIIKPGEKDIFRLPNDILDPEKNKVVYETKSTIGTDRTIDMKVAATHPGSAGGFMREVLTGISDDQQKNFLLDALGKGIFQNMNLVDYNFENMNEISSPLLSKYSLNAKSFSDDLDEMFVFCVPYMNPIQNSSAILSKTRYNRLDLSAINSLDPTVEKITVNFPKGYAMHKLPKDISVKGKYGTYEVKFKTIKGGLYVEKYQTFKKTIIDEKEFNEFKEFYLKLLDLDKTKVVIQKME